MQEIRTIIKELRNLERKAVSANWIHERHRDGDYIVCGQVWVMNVYPSDTPELYEDSIKLVIAARNALGNALKREGYALRNHADRHNGKYSVDMCFFDEINSEEKAYFLGFIAADGHVSRNGSIVFSQHVQQKDVLQNLQSALGCQYPLKQKNEKYLTFVTI